MNPAEYSTRAERERPGALAAVIAAAAEADAGARRRLRAPALLESWPGIVHGGALVALMDAAARAEGGAPGRRTIEGRLTASVPSETALDLDVRAEPGLTAVAVLGAGQILSSATVAAAGPAPPPAAWPGGRAGDALPTSDRCLACGASNTIGLRAALAFDAEGVWVRLAPPPAWREPDGGLHAALAPVLLDEVAWWLGALTMREGGLTNRITVTWHEPDARVAGAVVAAGRLADVAPVDRRRAFWRTAPVLLDEAGQVVASASIVFRGGAEYSERQLGYFRSRMPAERFARVFPGR